MQPELGIPGLSDLEEIGRGGSAVVYKARQESLDRYVAVKVIHASADAGVRRRFERERHAMGRLSEHPGIVQVHATGETRTGELYLVMPYYGAGTLDDAQDPGKPMPWERAVSIMEAVGRTVGDAHDVGIVHRDIKPANILLSSSGEPRVADFGISVTASTDQGMHSTTPTFTPFFAAPEMFSQVEASPTVDVYSLGATLYSLLSGQPPYRDTDGANDLLSIMKRASEEKPIPLGPGVPASIIDVIERSMAKDPDERPRNGTEFVSQLKAAAKQARTSDPTPTVFPEDFEAQVGDLDLGSSSERAVQKRRVLMAVVGVVALLVGGVALSGLLRGDPADAGPPPRTTVPGAPRIFGLDVVSITDTTARVVYRGDVCTGTSYVIDGLSQGASGYPNEDRCWDSHQLLLGRPGFTPGLLEADNDYTVTVFVYDEEGRASLPASVTFGTDSAYEEDRAVEISAFSISEETATQATIAFSTDLCAGSAFYLNEELLHIDGYPDSEWCWNLHRFRLGDRSDPLEPNTSYTVRVEALSRYGVITSDERSFTTARES